VEEVQKFIMPSNVEKIKERLGIVDVVGQYIKLQKAGSNLKAKCPFHNEKTPSFFVSPSRSTYYCFGCGVKGDIFSFVEQFEGLDFSGALKILAEKAGVQIEYEKQEKRDERDRLYSIVEEATLFFEESLNKEEGKDVKKYLYGRGLNDKTIKAWRIGYSPSSWSTLYEHLKKKHSANEIEKAGLIKKSEKGGDYYDRFRGRIMFPISDNSGRIIAFSGRIFRDKENEAKYINSPETSLFRKSKILYGLDRAKFSIRKLNFSIIVEGQIDLLASHQAGFTNTVALSGTALTEEQVELLKRLSGNVILAFDSDSAGFASSGKSAMLTLSAGMDVKIAHMSKGADPSDVINKDKDEWKKIIKNSKHIVDFSLDMLSEEIDDKRKLRLKAGQTVIPYIAEIANKIDQEHFISEFAHRLGISEDAVREEILKVPSDSVSEEVKENITVQPQPVKISSIENKVAAILLWQKSEDKPAVNVKSSVKELERIVGKDGVLRIMKKKDFTDKLLFEAERAHENSERLQSDLDELLHNLEQEYIKEVRDKILIELKSAEAENNAGKISKTLKRYKELSDKLHLNIGK
jgi:DNA primase|tara:strand:+ start:15120 stop:16850 length:1731 start_codon:yes stop_codon:yes gene_type:complete